MNEGEHQQRPKRTSVSVREGPKVESRTGIAQNTLQDVFNCCSSESTCQHRRSLADHTLKSESWTSLAHSESMQFAREGIVKVAARKSIESQDGDTFTFGNEFGENFDNEDSLDDFQRAVRCLKSNYKTFACTNFDRFIRENDARAMAEVWPKLESELLKSAATSSTHQLDDSTTGYASLLENFHAPASKKLPFAVVELYRKGNSDGARKILSLIFELISTQSSEISRFWGRCMESLVESCNSSDVQRDIYPRIVELTKGTSSNGRIGACILLRKLAKRFNSEVIERKVFPIMDGLVKDENYEVRVQAARSLPEMIHRLQKKNEALKLINVIKEDTDQEVKAALISTIMRSVTLMDPRDEKNKEYLESVMQTIKALVKDAYVKGNVELLISYSEHMGYVCEAFTAAGIMKSRDVLWYLDAYLQLSRYNSKALEDHNHNKHHEELPTGFANFRANMEFSRRHSIVEALVSTKAASQLEKATSQAQIHMGKAIAVLRQNAENKKMSIPYGGGLPPSVMLRVFGPEMEKSHECRTNAAKQFYDFMMFAKPIVGFRHGLHPLLTDLMHDSMPEVRAAIAEKLLEIMVYLGPEAGVLHGELVYALSDDDLNVVAGLVPHISQILKCLVNAKVLSPERITPKLVEIGGAILYCEERLNQTTFYKVHQTMLEQFNVLPFCLPGDYVYSNFVPALFHRLRHMRILPCRMAAAHAIVTFLRHCRRSVQREEMRQKIKSGFAQGRSVHDRMLFLYMAKKIMEMFSRKYFRDHFFEDVLVLANDPVGNVRRKVMDLMPELKDSVEDGDLYKKLEDTFRHARKSEVDRDVKAKIDEIATQFNSKANHNKGGGKIAQQKRRSIDAPTKTLPNKPQEDPSATDAIKELEEDFIAKMESKIVGDGTENFGERRRSFFGTTKRKSLNSATSSKVAFHLDGLSKHP